MDVQSEQQGSTHTQMKSSNDEIQRSKTIGLKEQIIQYFNDKYRVENPKRHELQESNLTRPFVDL